MENPEESFLKVLLWLILFITGVSAQTMILSRNLSEQVTPCKTGLIVNDTFVIRCQLDATGVDLSKFLDQVFFQSRQGSAAFQPECPVYLSDPCSSVPRRGCYCSSNSSQVYQLVYNDTAQTTHINADIQMQWTKKNSPSPVFSNILQIRDIYNNSNAVLELTVNGQLYAGTLFGNCDFNFTAKQQNKLELRAKNTGTPCYLRISLSSNGSTTVDDKADYASLTFTPVDETVTAVVEISYSMCTQSNYIPPVSCKAFTEPDHCCKCCHFAIPDIVFGVVLLAIGVTLSILLWLEKIEKKVVVIVYIVISIVFGVVLLVSGSVIGSQHCPGSHCPSGSTDKCDVCVYLIVLIAVFCVLAVLGIALLVVLCYCGSNAKKSISGGHNGSDRSANAQGMRKPSLVAPTNNRIDTVEDTDMDETAKNIKPEHTGKKNKKWKGEKQTNEQESSEMETFDVDLKMGRNNPKITSTEQPQKLPPIRGTDGAISTSATSSLPLTSNFPTSIGKTADPHAARPTSIEETSRPLPKPKTQKM